MAPDEVQCPEKQPEGQTCIVIEGVQRRSLEDRKLPGGKHE